MLVVVTGGPYSGKTTLVEALGRRGYATAPEAAIQVIAELVEELGQEGQRRFRTEHRAAFQSRVLRRQVQQERQALAAADGAPVFFDRCRLDGLAYCRHFGAAPPQELLRAATELRFDRILLLDTLRDAHVRQDTGRTSDRATSLALCRELAGVYSDYGYAPIIVPEFPIEERVAFVLQTLGLSGQART